MPYIKERSKKLELHEIDKFIKDHLPYRIKILEKAVAYPNKVNSDPLWPSIYESVQIVCRMFIQFFGYGSNGEYEPALREAKDYYSKDGKASYEVKITDLGFDFIQLDELNPGEEKLLAHAYEAGSKATAHLTYNTPFQSDPDKVLRAAVIIRRIMKSKLKI